MSPSKSVLISIWSGNYVYIDKGTIVEAMSIGNYVKIGRDCILGQRVVVGDNSIIMDNSIVNP